MIRKVLLLVLAGLALSACTTVPPTNVHQPMTARPAPRGENPAPNGSIYQAGVSRTLFEDRRARYIGDTLTVYPYFPETISVGGADYTGAAVHLIDTVEIASGD